MSEPNYDNCPHDAATYFLRCGRCIKEANQQLAAAKAEIARKDAALRGLLLSADCSWEENNEGHDWKEACNEARKALAATQPEQQT